jgi:hypothetical protein
MKNLIAVILLIASTNILASTTYYSDGSYAINSGNTTYFSDGSYAMTY